MMSRILLVVCLAALAAAPLVLPAYFLTVLIPFFAYSIILLGFNLLFGYGGQLSFGHAMFVAAGAYAAAASYSILGIASFEIMLAVAIVAALCLSIPLALVASRFTGIFFGVLTLSFGMLLHSILFKFYHLTGGESGMRVPRPTLLGMELDMYNKTGFLTGPFYYYCLILLVVLGYIMWRLVRSPYGLHLTASRDNPVKALYLGVRVRWVRTVAFIVSAVYGAIGGVMLGVLTGLADPELSYWTHSGHLVFMTILGGYQQFLGPAVGSLVMILVQDQLMAETQYWRFFVGLALALIVIALPGGILGGLRRLKLKKEGKAHADARQRRPARSTA
ncbi:branched-chain amino acid ABC transporter permease [Pusillimonas noertemannii]|uniref:Amino acid/amide ABC transporter membrane protein 2 (HAAT family) n=1 Tax=Pusillimonas noertemannii TaxID=305977 RepID=A0A2U1CPX0_9BURK|nr:branched-chain amino acid ABC transporter permease [Pusillimonas noertemannii]PVY67933.1 amino acid/amide ABC transporter membrane protein 2 (HAAT family) [Pusillimonas noertemannii]